jgi:flagellar hook-length control protein FliK
MSGILVLSDILKGGNKLEKTSTSKGKGVSDGPANAAAEFATMLSGSMNLNADPKGQNSKAGQDSEEKQSAQDPVPSAKLSNGQKSMIEYGNFALPNLFQPMLQSGLPAGKEANSGNDVSQGTVGLATAKTSLTSVPVVASNNLELALLNLVSLGSDEGSAQSGMTTPKPQGDNPVITELDKYRQVIGDLLVALSGEITNTSLKGKNASIKGQASEEQQSAGNNPVQSVQNPNGQGNMLGYANLALSNFFQPMLQSGLPAGKEANSGNDVSQGIVGLATAKTSLTSVPVVASNNLELALLNLVSQGLDEGSAQSGMTTPKPQGDNPAITELDKYRQVIANLLVVLSGEITNTSLKGKNASITGQASEEKQSAGNNPVQSVQNPNGQGNMIGYANLALSNFFQPMLQSDLPAGKEANSGNDVSQRTVGLATAKTSLTSVPVVASNNLELALMNLVSQGSDEGSAQSGMTTPKPQGDNPAITELNKYRQVIGDLLEKLSGEIIDNSPKGTLSASVSAGTKDLSQEMAKIVQGWATATDDVGEDGQASIAQKGIQPVLGAITTGISSGNPALNAKVATLLAALNPILSQGAEDPKASQGMNASFESFLKQIKGIDLNPVTTQVKDTALLSNVQQESEGMSPQKGDSTQSTELSGGKDVQNQNSSAGIGIASNLLVANVADGKTVAVPVWEQISTVIREQFMNRFQDLKQLDIQLHPADLGKIQIDLHWENGQVHLQVQASQAATGQLLQNHLSDLRQALVNHGVNCGMLQMGQGGEQQQNSHGDKSRRTFNQNTHLNEDEDLISANPPLFLEQDGINRINVMA